MRKIAGIILLLAYCGLCGLFLAGFYAYLHKPRPQAWNEAQEYLTREGRYDGEPVRFDPSWLRNYATDYSRFRGFNFSPAGGEPVFWLFATRETQRAGYEVVERRDFDRLVLEKLVREGHVLPEESRPAPPRHKAVRPLKLGPRLKTLHRSGFHKSGGREP